MMRDYFYDLATDLKSMLPSDFFFTAWLSGESSDFVRFNNAKVRQAGSVEQHYLQVDVIKGKRHSLVSLTLSGKLEDDRRALGAMIQKAQTQVGDLEEDPYLLYATKVVNSDSITKTQLPSPAEITNTILDGAKGLEFVGIHAQGLTHRGFANSLGQRNFITQETFNTDFSVYLSKDKAVKSSLAGKQWDTEKFHHEIDKTKRMLSVLGHPAKTIPKGSYRAFLAPAAVHEIISLLCWGGFSEKQGRTKQSPLMLLRDQEKELHSSVHMMEHTRGGISAPFQSGGFIRPESVSLIQEGRWVQGLISPRTAKEYDLETNGANNAESPESLDMAPGKLESTKVLSSLDTGVLINNLWYLNYSDRPKCKLTGMTRFATFWVEKGEIIAPINVMRFDDSLYRLLGSKLEALTHDRSFIIDQSTYDERSTQSMNLPGALVSDIAFTL